MAATLGADLILDVAGGGAGLDQRLDRALDVERTRAQAGVDIDQQRQFANVRDAAAVDQHVVPRVDAEIRQAEPALRAAYTREVDRLEAAALCVSRAVRIALPSSLPGSFGTAGRPDAREGR